MQTPRVEKVVVNIAVGESGEPLQRAIKVLNQLTGQPPCQRKAKRTIRDFGIHRREPIACLVTLRKRAASDFLKRTFEAIGNRLAASNFDVNGNFSFGISKHIDLTGIRYDPELGIFGMDVCVTIRKPGYHVRKRRINRAKVGKQQRLTKAESMEFIREEFGIDILGERST
jgi:large subunit ribosomal protein L5